MDDLVVYEAYIDEGKITLIKDQALVYIANCTDFVEVKEWSDRAAALEAYAQRKKNVEAMFAMRQLKLASDRQGGKLLIEMQNRKQLKQGPIPKEFVGTDDKLSLADLGITRQQAHDMRRLANMPQEGFDHYVATGERFKRPKNKLIGTMNYLLSHEKHLGISLETLKVMDKMSDDMRASIVYKARMMMEVTNRIVAAGGNEVTLKVVS